MTEFDAVFDDSHTTLSSGVSALRKFLDKKAQDFPDLSPRDARERIDVAKWLVGKTRYTKQQELTVQAIEANGFSLSVLVMISSYVGNLSGKREQWKLWRDLTEKKRPAGVIADIARKRVKILTQTPPKRNVGLDVIRGADGMSTVRYTVPQADAADIERSIKPATRKLMAEDSDLTEHQARGKAFAQLLANGGGVAPAPVIPMVNIPLEEHAQILRGEGDDIRLACSDGTELTGKEYAERALINHGIYNILSRIHGSLDNYRDERFATEKQRLAAFAENPTCVAPGCSVPFDDCQMHHVIAFNNGGLTNMDNIVPLCKYHNGKNDDDWALTLSRRVNGHVEKRGPFAYWISAYGFKDRRNEHRLMKLGAARKQFG